MTRQLDDLKPAEIKAAVLVVFPESGYSEVHHVLWYAAEQLGSSSQAVPQGYSGNRVQERYAGRVKRALDALAADGVLIRVGARERPPNNASPGSVSYWTPEAYEKAEAEAETARAANARTQERWVQVANRLDAAGVHLDREGRLSLEDWDVLLGKAGM